MPPVPEIVHRRAQRQLQLAVQRAVRVSLMTIALDRSQAIRETYATATARLVSGGERQSAAIAAAWIAGYAPPREPLDLARALDGRVMTPESDGALVGLLRLWSNLDDEMAEAQARENAGAMAAGLAQGDLLMAERLGLDAGAGAAGREARWAKIADPDGCQWCATIAQGGYRYHAAETVPFHRGCTCGVEPEFD